MSCKHANEKFVISKGIDNTFTFTIKASGSTLPIEITSTDTFQAVFSTRADGTVILEKALTVQDMLSGKVDLIITSSETDLFEAVRGPVEDRYYLKPSYTLTLDCSTAANGSFIAKVPEVYVD